MQQRISELLEQAEREKSNLDEQAIPSDIQKGKDTKVHTILLLYRLATSYSLM